MNNLIHNEVSQSASYLPDARIKPYMHPTAAIRNSQITGNVIIEEKVHIVNAVIRADEGTPFYIGIGSNIQDFVVLHGYVTQEDGKPIKNNLVNIPDKGEFSIYIGEGVTVAHNSLVHGPSLIGNNTFIGFKVTIDGANIGSNCEIGAHAYIKRVTIPDNTGIAPNAVITKQEDIEKYIVPMSGINSKIVTVNLEMAQAYNNE